MTFTHISLSDDSGGSVYSGESPLVVAFSTSACFLSKKVYRIDFEFPTTKKTIDLSYSETPGKSIPSEPGDPRNTILYHTFRNSNIDFESHDVKVSFWSVGSETPEVLEIKVNTTLPDFESGTFFSGSPRIIGAGVGSDRTLVVGFESQGDKKVMLGRLSY